jgi:hypothetical protein
MKRRIHSYVNWLLGGLFVVVLYFQTGEILGAVMIGLLTVIALFLNDISDTLSLNT